MPKQFVAVAGNIGAGKSTLVARLASRLGWKPYFEPVSENPYLEDFYTDMGAWAFHSQMFFLSYRMRYHHELLQVPGAVVQDRSVYEDAEIFAKNLYLQGHISERDYATYRNLFQLFIRLLAPPDMLIYLKTPVNTLVERIAERGRSFESGITEEYLTQLDSLYEEWIAGFALCPVLTVPAAKMDFATEDDIVEVIAREAQQMLQGKQNTLFELDDFEWK